MGCWCQVSSADIAKILLVIFKCLESVWCVHLPYCSPISTLFASCSADHTVKIWNTDRVFPIRTFLGHLTDINVCSDILNLKLLWTHLMCATLFDPRKCCSIQMAIMWQADPLTEWSACGTLRRVWLWGPWKAIKEACLPSLSRNVANTSHLLVWSSCHFFILHFHLTINSICFQERTMISSYGIWVQG